MTPKQADKVILANQPITVRNTRYDETFTATFVKRDRLYIHSADGGTFDRSELEIVKAEGE